MFYREIRRMVCIIGLTGKKFHGKDTAAEIIRKKHDVVCYSFADPIKKAVSIIHEIPESVLNDPESKEKTLEEWGKSPRELLQWLGTDVYRNQFGKEIWLKNMELRIRNCPKGYPIIVTDVRFDNEAELIHRLGGSVWKVCASERVQLSDSHESERGIDENLVDLTLYNNGTLEDFTRVVENEFGIKIEYNKY